MNIEEYFSNIEPYLKEGCSLHEACLHGEIPYTTMKDYYDKDDQVRKKIERLQNMPILAARRSVNLAMQDNGDLALKFLERKKKDEFSTRTEQNLGGQKDGVPIENKFVVEFVAAKPA